MEEDQESRFVCKLCFKKYPCGKSLGGHMRSHVVANSAESDEKFDANMKKFSSFGGGISMNDPKIAEFGNGQSSYGLRENPRKTWRAVDSTFPLPQEKICKQCGKGFHSLKALCGHMACHSEKDRGGLKDDHSWTSENQKQLMDSQSDTEAEDRIIRTRPSKSKRFRKIVIKSSFPLANNGSSSVSEIDGEEQEEVAMCLMLLSRDSGNKGGVNSVVESSDNNSVILETKSSSIDMRSGKGDALKNVHDQDEIPQMKKIGDVKLKDSVFDAEIAEVENSDSGYFLDECAKAESDVSVDGFRRNGGFTDYDTTINRRGEDYGAEFRQRSKSDRAELKKEFTKENEYDNGGMASRKRRYISENSEMYNEYERNKRNDAPNAENGNISQKRSKYECFNCKRPSNLIRLSEGTDRATKKSNAFYESRYESRENSLDDSTEFATRGKLVESTSNRKSTPKNEKKIKANKKNKGHVCPFCNRVFKNGQALGGHKRSHFIGGHEVNNNPSPVNKPDLLDLNLPAPQEDEDNESHDQYSPW